MTDNTTDVKEFLRTRIGELRDQLKAIEDAEFVAKTHMLVGRCYRYEVPRTDKDGVERVDIREFMKIIDASNGRVMAVSMKFRLSTGMPDIDFLDMAADQVDSFTSRCVQMTADEWAYHFRAHVLSLVRTVTGEDLRFEISKASA